MSEENVELLARDAAPHGPFRVSVEFEVLVDSDTLAHVDWEFPAGTFPTQAQMEKAAKSVRQAVRDQVGKGEWPSRRAFIRTELKARTGVDMTTPDAHLPFLFTGFDGGEE